MPLIPAKCPNCGASIEVEGHEGASICKYCKTALINEAAINNYYNYTKKVVNVENVDQLVYQDERSIDVKIENVETYISVHQDYGKARELLAELENIAPGRYEVWWNLIRANTEDLRKADCSVGEYNQVKEYSERMFKVIPPEIMSDIRSKWESFQARYQDCINDKRKDIQRIETDIKTIRHEKQIELEQLELNLHKAEESLEVATTENREIRNKIYNNKNLQDRSKYDKKRPVDVLLGVTIGWFIICIIVRLGTMGGYAHGVGTAFLMLGIILLVLAGYAKYRSKSNRRKYDNRTKQLDKKINDLNIEISELRKKKQNIETELSDVTAKLSHQKASIGVRYGID